MVFKDAAKYYSHIKARHADLLFNPMDLDGKFPEFKLAGSVLGFHGSSYKFTITEVSHFFTEVMAILQNQYSKLKVAKFSLDIN